MLDFHSKEIKMKVSSRLTEWIYKSIEYSSISQLIYKIEVDLKGNKKLMFIYHVNWLKMYLSNIRKKKFLFWVLILQNFRGKSNIAVCEITI